MTTPLAIGETIGPISIAANNPWNDTSVILVAGGSYNFAADGNWKDASIPANADGYPTPIYLKPFEWMRRVPTQRFFKLIGTIGKSMESIVVIGSGRPGFVPTVSGPLFCFANDVRFMYCNNHGELVLRVTRTA